MPGAFQPFFLLQALLDANLDHFYYAGVLGPQKQQFLSLLSKSIFFLIQNALFTPYCPLSGLVHRGHSSSTTGEYR